MLKILIQDRKFHIMVVFRHKSTLLHHLVMNLPMIQLTY